MESNTEQAETGRAADATVDSSPEAHAAEAKLSASVEKHPPTPVDPSYQRESPTFGTAGRQEIYWGNKGVVPGERAVVVEHNFTTRGPALTMAMVTFQGVEVTNYVQDGDAIEIRDIGEAYAMVHQLRSKGK